MDKFLDCGERRQKKTLPCSEPSRLNCKPCIPIETPTPTPTATPTPTPTATPTPTPTPTTCDCASNAPNNNYPIIISSSSTCPQGYAKGSYTFSFYCDETSANVNCVNCYPI